MKLNRLTLVLIAFIFSSTLFSQEYIALPEEDGFWKVEHYGPDCITSPEGAGGLCQISQSYLQGDTLINEVNYHKIYINGVSFPHYLEPPSYWGSSYQGCYRNDIANKKVFYIPYWDTQNEEVLLYDFNLEIGDTIQTYLTLDVDPENLKIVESIDSILISSVNNTYAKRYKISDYMLDLYIIEGVGSMGGVVDPILDGFEYSNDVICFQNDADGLNWDNGGNFSCDIISVIPEIVSRKEEMIISPNPAQNKIDVVLPKAIDLSNAIIYFYQINGHLLKPIKMNSSSTSINIENFKSGIYLIEIYNDGTIIKRSKFVKI